MSGSGSIIEFNHLLFVGEWKIGGYCKNDKLNEYICIHMLNCYYKYIILLTLQIEVLLKICLQMGMNAKVELGKPTPNGWDNTLLTTSKGNESHGRNN